LDADYLFATIQTLSKDDILQQFRPDTFDYIVIDEVHRAGASSYKKIISYFQPKFLLGMSATPERNDDFDIFQLFNYNIAYEIRLQQAMKENMICPFHYFGVTEIMVEGKLIDDHSEFNRLTSDERVRHIIEKIEFYGFSGDRVKGLIFCSRKEEAKSLSAKFNKLGYKTTALTGDDSQNIREAAIDALECADRSKGLDYIFTVDVFNEGVDIPSVNQVVMLRPTQSSIIFVQQLGRGLRKNATKEYVVVIDFIGNYEKNFLIPIALSGDHSYNKDTIRRYVAEGNRVIPGCSTVNFDHVTRDSIYASIDKADFNDIKLLKDSYFLLKQRLGRIPKLREFEAHGAIDVLRIIDKKGSYYQFLKQYDTDYEVTLTALEMEFMEFVSSKLANGKKVHELEFLSLLISPVQQPMAKFSAVMQDKYGIVINEQTRVNLVNMLTNNFTTGSGKEKYSKSIFIENNGRDYLISSTFAQLLENPVFKEMITDLIDFGIDRFLAHYGDRYKDTNFQLYQKYTYEDVCRCLDWAKGEVALNIGGYKFNRDTKTFPVFINYNKSEDVSATINYEDRFISPSSIIAISKSGRSEDSEDVRQIYNAENDGVKMFLFVRKNKDDKISKEFYCLGRIKAVGRPAKFVMRGTKKTAVEIKYQLETAVRQDIYEYIIG
jgi:superfamily II DNA or RNA helicase